MDARMAFAHVLRDDGDDIMTVHLDKCLSLESTVYQMNTETYEESVYLSNWYEQSVVTIRNTTTEPGNEESKQFSL